MKPIIIVGDIVVDVTLKSPTNPYKLRLGGIVHAARGAWALDAKYRVGYFAPKYLEKGIHAYLAKHGCEQEIQIGEVVGAPYVFLIGDVKEVGNQGYEFLLREEIGILYNDARLELFEGEEVFLISGSYQLGKVLRALNGDNNIHIDLANNIEDLSSISETGTIFSTIFLSTSSALFTNNFKRDFTAFAQLFRPYCKRFILKENRGGSRGFDFDCNEIVQIPSQSLSIAHSVGVGDVFDAAYISSYQDRTFKEALYFSAWVAGEYAATTFPDDFKLAVERIRKVDIDDLMGLGGVFVPWEKRYQINIYIAAPDFDFMDTTEIDRLANSLAYHNFSPRRPVKENGQMELNADAARRRSLFEKDIKLLEECEILIAVIVNNDPGTLVEIGLAKGMGLPTIVYDPYKLVNNCMLSELPSLVAHDLDEIVREVFKLASKIDA